MPKTYIANCQSETTGEQIFVRDATEDRAKFVASMLPGHFVVVAVRPAMTDQRARELMNQWTVEFEAQKRARRSKCRS